jgi:large subunit ribosomal protein L24
MNKTWSSEWVKSRQPRKQRKYSANAPNHVVHKLVSAHLSPALRDRYGKRSMPVRKGDDVRVTTGKHKGVKGTVDSVDLKKRKVFMDSLKIKKADGSEVMRPIEPSNLMITSINLDDKMRQKVIERAVKRPAKEGKR